MVKEDNGKFVPHVLDASGDRRLKDLADVNSFMSIGDLVAEMEDSATYAACFKGTGSSGSGKHVNDKDNKQAKKNKNVKHLKHDDAAGISENLEGIANGTVIVDMPIVNPGMMIQDG